jgi:HD-like signal output (HDOD) protein
MSWFQRRPITPLPQEQTADRHLSAVLTEAQSLPGLPSVVVDLLNDRVEVSRIGLQAALESDPVLTAELTTAWRVQPLERLLQFMPPEIVFDRLVEIACLRHADSLGTPLSRGPRQQRWRHLVAVAGAARVLSRNSDDARGPQRAFVAGAMHLFGIYAVEHYIRNHWPGALAQGQPGIADCAESIGCCHWQVGGALLQARGLPESIWRAVASQGRRAAGPLADLLASARRCAQLAGYPAVIGETTTQPAPLAGIQGAGEAVRQMKRLQASQLV